MFVAANLAIAILAAHSAGSSIVNEFLAFLPAGPLRNVAMMVIGLGPVVMLLTRYQQHSPHPLRWWELPAYGAAFALYVYMWAAASLLAWAPPRARADRLGEDATRRAGGRPADESRHRARHATRGDQARAGRRGAPTQSLAPSASSWRPASTGRCSTRCSRSSSSRPTSTSMSCRPEQRLADLTAELVRGLGGAIACLRARLDARAGRYVNRVLRRARGLLRERSGGARRGRPSQRATSGRRSRRRPIAGSSLGWRPTLLPDPRNADNLRSEGVPEDRVLVTGNTVIDALLLGGRARTVSCGPRCRATRRRDPAHAAPEGESRRGDATRLPRGAPARPSEATSSSCSRCTGAPPCDDRSPRARRSGGSASHRTARLPLDGARARFLPARAQRLRRAPGGGPGVGETRPGPAALDGTP